MADMHDVPVGSDSIDITIDESAQAERNYHTYHTHHIPIYVRLMWVGFYCLAAWYLIQFLFPSIREEFHVEPKARRHVVGNP